MSRNLPRLLRYYLAQSSVCIRILMHSMTRGMLVGHRRVAGSNKSSHYDHRLIPCAVGSVPVRLGIYKPCREEPKHMDNNVCSRTLTDTCTQEEPKHRKDLERSADFRSDLVRKAASEGGGAVYKKSNDLSFKKNCWILANRKFKM